MSPASRTTLASLALGRGRSARVAFCVEILYVLGLQSYFDNMVPRADGQISPALIIISILATWMLLSATSRRAHDIGVPGWAGILFLLVGLGTSLDLIVESGMQTQTPSFVLGLLTSVVVVGALALLPGTRSTNRWGPPPSRRKARHGSMEVVQ